LAVRGDKGASSEGLRVVRRDLGRLCTGDGKDGVACVRARDRRLVADLSDMTI